MARVDVGDGDGDELLRLYALSPAMGGAAGAFSAAVYGSSVLPTRVREVARMRIAAANACPVCLDTRTVSDPEGLTTDEYEVLVAGGVPTGLSERETVAGEFAHRFATDHLAMDDDLWARARAAFTDVELFELGVCCASWLGLGRLTQVFDAGVDCRIEL
jgi:alkylhydroperoxidase family enzyme